ncbi:MAG: alpha/beta hydrolase [Solirubrobacteraceae bacterium]
MSRIRRDFGSVQSVAVRGLMSFPDALLRGIVGEPVALDGQRLHVEVQLALKLLALAGAPALNTLSVSEARSRVSNDARKFEGVKFDGVLVCDVTVAGAAGPLRGRLYVPEPGGTSAAAKPEGLLVYFHGGGFVVCDLETHDNPCRFLARQAGVRVLSVDYRRAPEDCFPAAIDDALAAFRYIVEHAREFGADPARVAVGGDSAGGNLAAGVARLTAGDSTTRPAFQLLLYPWLDLSSKRQSYRLFGNGFYLTESDLDWYKSHYLIDPGDAVDARCSPLLSEDLADVPPGYIATAGFDPLRDEGEEYAVRLRGAGVPAAVRRHPDLIHGFFNTVAIGHVARAAVLEAADALQLALAQR